MTPVGAMILVRPIEGAKEKRTEAGIILEGKILEESYDTGEVIEVSEDISNARVKKGDTILYDKGAGLEVEGGRLMEYRHARAII